MRKSKFFTPPPLAVLLAVMVLAVAGAVLGPERWTMATLAQSPSLDTLDISGEAAMRHVEALSVTIGSRPAGTAAQDQAVEYIASQFSSFGYEPFVQQFSITHYNVRRAEASTVSPMARELRVLAFQYSGWGEVEAPLVYAGLGTPEDLARVDAAGKVVLVERGVTRFAEKVAAAADAGAVGVLVFNSEPGVVAGTLQSLAPIPALSLDRADGLSLVEAVEAGAVTVHLLVDAQVIARAPAYNVVAIKPGGPSTVVIGAHYDSVDAGPGANDNASGTATLLEIARVLAGRDLPFTFQFVAFGAEELGLIGSRYFVSQLSPEERAHMVAMFNLDMVGVGDELLFAGDQRLVDLARQEATYLAQPSSVLRGAQAGGSDHVSFLQAGIPAVFVYRADDPRYHTAADRAEFVDLTNLQVAGRLVVGVLEQLAAGQ